MAGGSRELEAVIRILPKSLAILFLFFTSSLDESLIGISLDIFGGRFLDSLANFPRSYEHIRTLE